MHHALGRNADELARHLAHAFLQTRLARLPSGAAKPVEFARLRAVTGQKLKIFDWQEQPVAAGIVNFQTVVWRARRLDCLQADEAADAVVDMNDEIAGGKRARFGENVLGAPAALRLPYETVAENVLLAENREVRRFEPLFQRDDSERQRASARCRRLMIGRYELECLEAMLGQHVAEPLTRTVAPARNDHVQAPLAQRPHMRDRGVEHI